MGKQSRSKAAARGGRDGSAPEPSAKASKARRNDVKRPGAAAGRVGPLATIWATWSVFLGVLIVYLLTIDHGAFSLNDATAAAAPAWTLAKGQTLALDSIESLRQSTNLWTFTVNGSIRSDRFPGPVLASYPFYIFGPKDFSMIPGAVMGAVTTASAVALLHRTLVRVVAPLVALVAALLFAFGTGAWTTAAATPLTHGPALLGLAIGTWALASGRMWVAGLGYGAAMLSRPHLAVVALVTGVWESWRVRSVWPAVKVGLGAALGLVVLVAYSKANADTWNFMQGSYQGRPGGSVDVVSNGGLVYLLGKLAGVLFAPKRGIFVLSPFLLLLLPGLRSAWRAAPTWVRSSAVGGLFYLAIQLFGNTWTGGASYFGYRITLEPLLLLTPLLAMSGQRWVLGAPWRIRAFLVLSAVSLWWFALGGIFWAISSDPDETWSTFDVVDAVSQAGPVGVLVSAAFALGVVYMFVWAAKQRAARVEPVIDEVAERELQASS